MADPVPAAGCPGLLWLGIFYVYPGIQMFLTSLWTGTLEKGFDLTWNWSTYGDALDQYGPQFLRSIVYGGRGDGPDAS